VERIVELRPAGGAIFTKSPELINEQEIKAYFLYNRNVKQWSRAAFSVPLNSSSKKRCKSNGMSSDWFARQKINLYRLF